MAGLLASAATGTQAAYVFYHSLNIPGGNNPNNFIYSVNGINAAGNLVGTIQDYINTGATSGFVDTTSVAYDPGNGGGNTNEIRAVNSHGAIAGNYMKGIASVGFYSAGFAASTPNKLSKPAVTLIDPNTHGGIPAVQTWAYGLNDNGIVVGYDQVSNGNGSDYYSYTYNTATHTYADLPDHPASSGHTTKAVGINNSNWIVGNYSDATAGSSHGFLYKGGSTWSTIDDPNAVSGRTYVTGLNNLGQVVGWYADNKQFTHGFVYDVNSNAYITVDDPKATSTGTVINAINDSGDLVGTIDSGTGFLATTGGPQPAPPPLQPSNPTQTVTTPTLTVPQTSASSRLDFTVGQAGSFAVGVADPDSSAKLALHLIAWPQGMTVRPATGTGTINASAAWTPKPAFGDKFATLIVQARETAKATRSKKPWISGRDTVFLRVFPKGKTAANGVRTLTIASAVWNPAAQTLTVKGKATPLHILYPTEVAALFAANDVSLEIVTHAGIVPITANPIMVANGTWQATVAIANAPCRIEASFAGMSTPPKSVKGAPGKTCTR